MRPAILLILCLGLAACVHFPEIAPATSQKARDADYPDLIPFDPLLAAQNTALDETAEMEAQLEARVSGLQARAATLRRSVLSGQDRSRLEEDVQ